jgi:hypothetical protein
MWAAGLAGWVTIPLFPARIQRVARRQPVFRPEAAESAFRSDFFREDVGLKFAALAIWSRGQEYPSKTAGISRGDRNL